MALLVVLEQVMQVAKYEAAAREVFAESGLKLPRLESVLDIRLRCAQLKIVGTFLQMLTQTLKGRQRSRGQREAPMGRRAWRHAPLCVCVYVCQLTQS